MQRIINMHEAKTQLSRLVQALHDGRAREFVIAVAGKPHARLVPFEPRKRPSGMDAGLVDIADNFDVPDKEFEKLFYEGPVFSEDA
jgi:antitoxin (DNA-binding transcriptional repressor) of toxin-antitoxin stability system